MNLGKDFVVIPNSWHLTFIWSEKSLEKKVFMICDVGILSYVVGFFLFCFFICDVGILSYVACVFSAQLLTWNLKKSTQVFLYCLHHNIASWISLFVYIGLCTHTSHLVSEHEMLTPSAKFWNSSTSIQLVLYKLSRSTSSSSCYIAKQRAPHPACVI